MPDLTRYRIALEAIQRDVRATIDGIRPQRMPYVTSATIDPPHVSEIEEYRRILEALDAALLAAIEIAREI